MLNHETSMKNEGKKTSMKNLLIQYSLFVVSLVLYIQLKECLSIIN